MVSAAVASGRLGSEEDEGREAQYGGEDNHKERGIIGFAGANMPWTQSEVWPAVRPQIVERSREAKCPSRARRA